MTFAESFEPESVNLDPSSLPNWIGESIAYGSVPVPDWQSQLLPIACVAQEDNVSVLQQQLETAHHLLTTQQETIQALHEQLNHRQLQYQQTQQRLATVQQTCDRQVTEVTEVRSVCRDLKAQLRRQQQRVIQYRTLLDDHLATPASVSAETTPQNYLQPLGFSSFVIQQPALQPAARKAPPVSAWSAPDSVDLTGPLACYRQLATIRMTRTTVAVETFSHEPQPTQTKPSTVTVAAPSGHQTLETHLAPTEQTAHRLDLPAFVRSC